MAQLTSEAVRELAKRVLFTDEEMPGEEPPANAIRAPGILREFAFHPGRIAEAKPEIDALLLELPETFQRTGGGGWTFLNACMDKHGRHWGEHPDMEMLFCLGIAAGSAEWLMKDMADMLPGGMPYVQVYPTAQQAAA